MTKALTEATKELGRVALIAMLPLAIDALAAGAVNWRLIATAGAIAVLRAIDKWVHENPNIKSSGILPF